MKVTATIQSGTEMRKTNAFSIQVVTNPFRECQIASKVTFTTEGRAEEKSKIQGSRERWKIVWR